MSELPLGEHQYESVEDVLRGDPETAALAQELRSSDQVKPGLAEARLHRIEDEETLADPRLQESIRQMEAGDVSEITDADLENVKSRADE